MNEQEALAFLVSLGALLAVARVGGEAGRAIGMPLVAGEVGAGVLLGPTVLGRVAPRFHAWLFPESRIAESMLGGFTTVAMLLLLVVVGIEVDLGIVRRRGRSALLPAALGLVFPFAAGIATGYLLPETDLVDPARRASFAALLGVAFSISALPIIGKALLDAGIAKTDIGLLTLAVAMSDALIGWLAFGVLAGPMRGGAGLDRARPPLPTAIALSILLFAASVLAVRRLVDRVLASPGRETESTPGRVVSLTLLLGLLGAGLAQAIGVHPAFGAFAIGVGVGDSTRLTEQNRVAARDLVTSVFAPVFFASLAARLDFARAFDMRLFAVLFAVGVVAKGGGAAIGARVSGLRWREAFAVGSGLSSRGGIGVVLAALALRGGLIRVEVFVALVLSAIATSLVFTPTMKRLLLPRVDHEEDVVALLRRGAFVSQMHSTNPTDAIGELVRALGSLLKGFKRSARDAVVERELLSPTGLGNEVAIPHAAVPGLEKPLLALGRAPQGIDFDAPDGKKARIVFLLLIPPKAYEEEVRILASIARAVFDDRARADLMKAQTFEEVTQALATSAHRIAESQRPPAIEL